MGLDVHRTSPEWACIQGIRTIRNFIAHRDGKLAESQDEHTRAIIKNLGEMISLTSENEIVIRGLLLHVVDTCGSYFRLINESIKATEKA